MSIPTRVEAAATLREFEPPEWLTRHSGAVAEVAACIAHAMARRGIAIDPLLVETAALLHDIGKSPGGPPVKEMAGRVDHARRGAAWLRDNGLEELADAVEQHPVTVLGTAPSYEQWAIRAGLAGQVVSYSDKRARQEIVSLDERFTDWYTRHGQSELLDTAYERARQLEAEICAAAGMGPEEVARLPWVADALGRARDGHTPITDTPHQ